MKWDGELYLELHNGTYTSVSDIKKYNREMETLLRDVEIISSYAALINKDFIYDADEIRDIWHTFLIDQFHDVLPGTSINMVYDDTKQNSIVLRERCMVLLRKSFESISKSLLDGLNVESVRQYHPRFDGDLHLQPN